MITVYDNKTSCGHLTLVCHFDHVIAFPTNKTKLELVIDDFMPIPEGSYVLILDGVVDAGVEVGRLFFENYVTALVTSQSAVRCCRFRKNQLKITT